MSGKKSRTTRQRGFTRIELAIVLGTVSLIGAMGLTVLGDNRERSERVVCANNLRQVGRAFHMWASDHGGENPWWVRYLDGGSLVRSPDPTPLYFDVPGVGRLTPALLRNNAWFQFAFINQELRTPALLVCPSEQNKVHAQDFSAASSRGYVSVNFRNRATSYFVGLHGMNQYPSSILSGDRTLSHNGFGDCTANVGVVAGIYQPSRSGWFPGLHNLAGNLLLNDGRVEELSNSGLGEFLNPVPDDTTFTVTHLLIIPN